jgi:hypothetical protein
MILVTPTLFTVERLFRLALGAVSCIALWVLADVAFSFAVRSWEQAPEQPQTAAISSGWPHARIGNGPLALNGGQESSLVPDLGKELLLLAIATRPDVPLKDTPLLVGLRTSKEKRIVASGQPLFLDFSDGQPLKFSSEAQALWIKPLVLDRASALIEAGLQRPLEGEGGWVDEKVQFVASVEHKERRLENGSAYDSLVRGKLWGKDALLQLYGGEEYRRDRDKVKVEFSSVLLVEEGDYLGWDGMGWQKIALSPESRKAPIAQVRRASPQGVEIDMWDKEGFYPQQVKLEPQPLSRLAPAPEHLPSSLRLRTATQVTCLLGKRRAVLKKGDWLLRTPAGWRVLKSVREIEECIQHKMRGELLVIDGLERTKNRVVLKGCAFDEMRTQSAPVNIPVAEKKGAEEKK